MCRSYTAAIPRPVTNRGAMGVPLRLPLLVRIACVPRGSRFSSAHAPLRSAVRRRGYVWRRVLFLGYMHWPSNPLLACASVARSGCWAEDALLPVACRLSTGPPAPPGAYLPTA